MIDAKRLVGCRAQYECDPVSVPRGRPRFSWRARAESSGERSERDLVEYDVFAPSV